MNLKSQLKKLKEESMSMIPDDIKKVLKTAAENLAKEEIEKNALKLGDTIPNFKLKNAVGEWVDTTELLEQGPLVISFYRGAWCPYCNLELQAYQEILPEIHDLGAQFVAISPELPDRSLSLVEKHSLKYEVLSDLENEVARKFKIVFGIEDELKEAYELLNVDLAKTQGNERYELPIPATYVIDENGKIILAHVYSDYTTRLEPQEVLRVL